MPAAGPLNQELRILHSLSLATVGGVERYFSGFLRHRSRHFAVHHGVMLSEPAHPFFAPALRELGDDVHYAKQLGLVRIPRWPAVLREEHCRHAARRYAPGIGLVWNLLGDVRAVERSKRGGLTAVYWERGMAWFEDKGRERIEAFLGGVDGVLANSRAGARVLQLGWGYQGPIAVHRNALRADGPPPRTDARAAPRGRPLRIGVCGRLLPFKGTSLALHALASLRARGVECELEVAGSGPLEAELRELVRRLGIERHAVLLGEIEDTTPFYDRVDLLLHPALREPCANAIVEGLSRGLPVVATLVDGTPELVIDGRTGRLVAPTLPLADYARFGGAVGRMPLWVYDPRTDRLAEPRLADPEQLADAILDLVQDPERYRAASAAALDDVRERFDTARELESVLRTLHGFMTAPAARAPAPGR